MKTHLSSGNSPRVVSSQVTLHPRLDEVVRRHSRSLFRKPVSEQSQVTFQGFLKVWARHGGALILDSGCGTGDSSRELAETFPESLVVGVDKSAFRLAKAGVGNSPPNLVLLRMDLVDFWGLSSQASLRFDRQNFFYPNPWPKSEHLLKRWPAHPVFPLILACGGVLELRTNWLNYALEWARAFELLTGQVHSAAPWAPQQGQSAHERKYLASDHALWRWSAKVPDVSAF